MLDQYWAPYKITHPELKLRHHAIHLLKISQVKSIIFDEIHSILTGSA
ncbi:TniB family NTP-binding protein, partial [Aliarcobacter butzleri]